MRRRIMYLCRALISILFAVTISEVFCFAQVSIPNYHDQVRGPVKTLNIAKSYYYYEKNILKQTPVKDRSVHVYNKNSALIESRFNDDKYVYQLYNAEYSDNNLVSEKYTSFCKDEIAKIKYEYKYDKSNRVRVINDRNENQFEFTYLENNDVLVKRKNNNIYDFEYSLSPATFTITKKQFNDNQPISTQTYHYDKSWKLLKYSYFDNKQEEVINLQLEYNNNNFVSRESLSIYGQVTKLDYEYKYDDNNNWIEKKTLINIGDNEQSKLIPYSVTYRSLSYYTGTAMTRNDVMTSFWSIIDKYDDLSRVEMTEYDNDNNQNTKSNRVDPAGKSSFFSTIIVISSDTDVLSAQVKAGKREYLDKILELVRYKRYSHKLINGYPSKYIMFVRTVEYESKDIQMGIITDYLEESVPEQDRGSDPAVNKINVSGGVLQVASINRVQPKYSNDARREQIQGIVKVKILISINGDVLSAVAIDGPVQLRCASVTAARQWKFKPTLLKGLPVKVQGELTFKFSLP